MPRAKAKATIDFQPEVNIARNGSVISDDQAAGVNTATANSGAAQRQHVEEGGAGEQTNEPDQ